MKLFPVNSKELVLDPDRGAKFWKFDNVLDYAADYMKKMRHAHIWLPQVCLCLGSNVLTCKRSGVTTEKDKFASQATHDSELNVHCRFLS